MKNLEKIAKEALEFNKADVVYVTSDGVSFLDRSFAQWHAYTLTNKTIHTYNKDGEIKSAESSTFSVDDSEKTATKVKAEDLIAAINKSTTLEELEAISLENENRSTVLKAYGVKKAELEKGKSSDEEE